MSEKKHEPAPEKGAAPAAADAAGAAAGGGGIKALLPAILAIVLAPAVTWAVATFVILPKFRASLALAAAGELPLPPKEEPKAEKAGGHGGGGGAHGGGKEKPAEPAGFKFENVVVNLSGTMGTRYLKVSFLVTGAANIKELFDAAKPQLTDVTLGVLSSLTLADLEESGAKNIIRERLLAAYNQALGKKTAENLFFSEFVVQ
ncbi:MAG: flagellar basal body-associated FliL family protein [Verrucomicrobia bacterium]|nr:flagellar basal body-associated FliL family protein [Verrucomicrobiota bacterium]